MKYLVIDAKGRPIAIFLRRREAEMFMEQRQGFGYSLLASCSPWVGKEMEE